MRCSHACRSRCSWQRIERAMDSQTRLGPTWRLEFGANPTAKGVLFRAWAPLASRLAVCVTSPRQTVCSMDPDAYGIFTAFVENLEAGTQYYYEFEHDRRRP